MYQISFTVAAGNTLKYEPGKIYSYKLEGNSVTKLTGATGDQSKVGITADVQVSLLSSCEHVLKVTNVQVSGPDAKVCYIFTKLPFNLSTLLKNQS